MSEKYKAVAIRFLKGFAAGGITQVLLIINAGATLGNLADLKAWVLTLIGAFITGGLLALQKLISWQDEPQN